MSLNCKCGKELFVFSVLCLYQQRMLCYYNILFNQNIAAQGVACVIKPELVDKNPSIIDNSLIAQQHPDSKKRRYSPEKLYCKSCKRTVGNTPFYYFL